MTGSGFKCRHALTHLRVLALLFTATTQVPDASGHRLAAQDTECGMAHTWFAALAMSQWVAGQAHRDAKVGAGVPAKADQHGLTRYEL